MKGNDMQRKTLKVSSIGIVFWVLTFFGFLACSGSVFAQTERGWDLQVVINNADGRPVSNAIVELVFNDASRVLADGTTDSRGRASLSVPTRRPNDLGPLNLLVFAEAAGHVAEIQRLQGSPDRIVVVQLSRALDQTWSQRNGPALRDIAGATTGTVDLLIATQGGTAPSVSAGAAVLLGDKNLALPPGWGEIQRECHQVGQANFVVNGRIAFGRHRGRSIQDVCLPEV